MDDKFIQQLKRHEGYIPYEYKDHLGFSTIGFGRLIQKGMGGITEAEAQYLLMNDVSRVMKEAEGFEWFKGLNEPRKAVIVNMLFNLGLTRFNNFLKMKQALAEGDHLTASREMIDSRWARQVKGRATELAKQMETGKWQQS